MATDLGGVGIVGLKVALQQLTTLACDNVVEHGLAGDGAQFEVLGVDGLSRSQKSKRKGMRTERRKELHEKGEEDGPSRIQTKRGNVRWW